MSEIADILASGVASEFWQLFTAHVEREWGANGARFQAEMDRALNLTDNDAAASQARQVRSGQKVILALMRWPSDEIRRLKDGAVPEPEMGRAPINDLVTSGMSRRGSL